MQNLLDEIEDYWSTRTEGYSEVNEKELLGSQKKAWLEVLLEQFPNRPKDTLRILDIGTGPGFFPIILANAGFQVDAVDYTQGMLNKAQENARTFAGEHFGNIHFRRMDAQNLQFDDETFDVVISRNLTWNLENPVQAYREWQRVLKTGGKLLNFDANWYGYLYDEEKREAYEKDRENVENNNLDDHYLCTDIDRMEEIARKVPLSGEQRPAWDAKVLEDLGFTGIVTDHEIWERVWSKEEKLNYQSTPMFMAAAVKGPAMLALNNMTIAPGTKESGFLEIGEGEFSLPTTVIRGENPGKTVLITAGIHPGECVGVQAAVELAQRLDVKKVNGTVVIVKVVCREEFELRAGSLGLEDHKNLNREFLNREFLNREFPGAKEGTKMERLAAAVVQDLHKAADYYIDLHSGDDFEQLTPYVYYAGEADPEVVKISRRMAEQADVPYMVKSNVASGGSYNYAASCGIPSILLERGSMGGWTEEEAHSTRRDVRNILCFLGIYSGQKEYSTYYPLEVQDVRYQSASEFGLWYPEKKAGSLITAGEYLGCVKDYQGNVLESCVSDCNGVILFQTGTLQVTKEGPMIAYGRIAYEQDDRKERIASYWTKRSDSFLQQRRAELHSPLGGRWMAEISKYLPEDKKLKVLDVGCGAGFFGILLGRLGHEVTGIDLTPDMITHARELAEEEKMTTCAFQVMDAEHLDFEDESFDLVISRNLTWTLPEAAQAYKEWCRVLKKGGILLNMDANYGAADFADTSELPENHAHFQIEDEMMKECEEIKRQLPISSYMRPAWDLETLGRLEMERYSIDLGISRRIYIEKDEFYNPTPMFLVCAEKRA